MRLVWPPECEHVPVVELHAWRKPVWKRGRREEDAQQVRTLLTPSMRLGRRPFAALGSGDDRTSEGDERSDRLQDCTEANAAISEVSGVRGD